jgi:hypothetical protein
VNDIVLDASALLAVLRSEAGAERVEPRLAGSGIGAVNLSEVVAKLIEDGVPEVEIRAAVGRLQLDVPPSIGSRPMSRESFARQPAAWACPSAIAPALRSRSDWEKLCSRPTGPGRASSSTSGSR